MEQHQDIEPFVIYRIDGGQMECALWKLQTGQDALALFLSGDSATTYMEPSNPDSEWKIFQPPKEVLSNILRVCYESGIIYAVLDPDTQQARRIFSIKEILDAVDGA
tara:strand:- start:28 stop:348 length:321 start_codon:yes stop_codon:yes gene_type:complete